MEVIFADLAYMAACWGFGLFTGLGIGCAMGVDRHTRQIREADLEDS